MTNFVNKTPKKAPIFKKQSQNTTNIASAHGYSNHEQILQLQRTLGNQATQQLLSGETLTVSVPSSSPNLRMSPPDTKDTANPDTSSQSDKSPKIQRTPLIKQKMLAQQIARKKKKMHLDFVRMKRQHAHIGEDIMERLGFKVKERDGGTYGHWWVEVGNLSPSGTWAPSQSYGWWPSESVNSIKKTMGGVPGVLNRGNTNDPHHGDNGEEEFHPTMTVDDSEDYDTIRSRVEGDITNFANNFSGSWNWRLGWGKNCHTFQMRMKKQLHLHNQKSKHWLKDPEAGNRESTSVFDEAGKKDPTETKTAEFEMPKHRLTDSNEFKDAGSVYIGQEVGFTDLVIKVGGKNYYEIKTEDSEYFWMNETFAKEDMMWSESYN